MAPWPLICGEGHFNLKTILICRHKYIEDNFNVQFIFVQEISDLKIMPPRWLESKIYLVATRVLRRGINGAYWPSWKAETLPPLSIPIAYFTHVFYAFILFDATSFELLITQNDEQCKGTSLPPSMPPPSPPSQGSALHWLT